MDLINRNDAIKKLAFVLENMDVSLYGIKGERLAKLILDDVPAADTGTRLGCACEQCGSEE